MSSILLWFVIPMLTGIAVCVGFFFLDRSRYVVKGVVAPYFAAIALLFSLFASHTTVEVWQKVGRINALMFAEASAIRGMLRISEPFEHGSQMVRATVENLLHELREQETQSASDEMLGERVPASFPDLYLIAADPRLFDGNQAANAAFYTALEQMRQSWFERSELRRGHIAAEKYLILFAFGLMTQISIALSHVGNPRPLAVTVMLFSLAFALATGVIAALDEADQPSILASHAVLDHVLNNPMGTPGSTQALDPPGG